MLFDNRDKVIKLNKRRYIVLLIYLVLMVILILPDLFSETILGYDKSIFIGVFTALYVIYVVYAFILNFNYLSYSDENDKLIFRFVSLRPFDNKKRAVEIQKKDFIGYKFKKSFFNLKQDLILQIKTKKGVASYPPISVSALSLKHKNMLISSLNQYV